MSHTARRWRLLAGLLAAVSVSTVPASAVRHGPPLDCRLDTAATMHEPLTRREVDRCVSALVDQLEQLRRALDQAEARIRELERRRAP